LRLKAEIAKDRKFLRARSAKIERFGLAGTLLGCIVIAACAPLQTKPTPLPLPPQRIYQNTYSLVPPNEPGWIVTGRRANELGLARGGDKPDETFAIQGSPIPLPAITSREDLVRFVHELLSRADARRFKILKREVAEDRSRRETCTRSIFVTEDHAAVRRTSTPGPMILEALSLTCVHPKNPALAVMLTYSHRYYPEQNDPGLGEKAARVLSTLEFLDP
jgi:hypothetical protein